MKNKILKTSVKLALIILALAICCLDSDSYIPYIVALITLAYLGLFMYANKDRLERRWDNDNKRTIRRYRHK